MANKFTTEQANEENAYTLGVQAYLWGLPLCEYGKTDAASLKAGAVRINEFHKFTTLKTARDRYIVTPNNVTIDAYAVIDLSQEPVVVFVPALREPRWYIGQIGDKFDEIVFNVAGSKGPQPGTYVLTGPDFRGAVPGDMIRVASRTKGAVMGVRIFVNGEADLPNALEAQKGFALMPLSAYLREGLAYKPSAPPPFTPFESSAPADISFFAQLGHEMQRNFPVSADSDDAFIAALHSIGLSVAKGFDWESLDEAARRGLARAAQAGEQIVDARWQALGETTNGWRYTMSGGRAGHNFALRAALAKGMLGAQLADQVIYPNTRVDDKGELLTGARKYVLRFAKGQQPAAATFWNMAMYDEGELFVENDFARYSIGSTTDGLKPNPDGSLTILIQNERPADTANWLPAPTGSFNLTMRFYGTLPSVLDGSYRLPAVQRVE